MAVPFNVATAQGHLSIQIQEDGRDVHDREIPIINVRCAMLAGTVNDPAILIRESFKRAQRFAIAALHINNNNARRSTVRMSIEARGMHATDWGSPTILIRTTNQTVQDLVAAWESYLISEPDVNLANGALTIYYQFVFDLHHSLPGVRELVGGAAGRYQAVKARMWCPISKLDYYVNGKGLLEIPITDSKLCFVMAFLTCQCRQLIKNESGVIYSIIESVGTEKGEDIHSFPNQLILCEDDNLAEKLLQYLPQYINSDDQIVLFNPFKYHLNRSTSIKVWLDTPQKLNTFILLAKYIHQYVENQLQHQVTFTNLEEVAQAYADVFQVYIHIRRFQLRAQQSKVYFPTTSPLNESHIVIMISNNDENEYAHADSVTHIREFTKSKTSATLVNISSYCDYCQKYTTSNNTNKQKDYKHLNECRESFFQYRGNKTDVQFNEQRQQYYWDKSTKHYKCNLCYACVTNFNAHQCYATYKPIQPPMNENKLFVFDVEARQDLWKQDDHSKKYLHTVNLVCIRSVYTEEYSEKFPTIDSFLVELLSNKIFHGCTILAHNGGSYDCQFILQYLEKNNIPFKNIPRPGSLHKYIQLEIIQKNSNPSSPGYDSIIFKDFMMFIPGSLRNIALAFKCNLTKGDFPHRFNKIEHQNHIGPIPPIDSEEDYYSLKYCKDPDQKKEIMDWYHEQTTIYCTCTYEATCHCSKQKWNLQEQLATYCWLDVNVLAECVRKFRDAHLLFGKDESSIYDWIPNPIDPFVYCTQSQIAMSLFLAGHSESNQPAVSPIKHRSGWSKVSIEWLEHISQQQHISIHHYGNSDREYYDQFSKRFVDGYCSRTNTVYQFHGCYYHGCLHCFCPTDIHPQKNVSYQDIYNKTQSHTLELQKYYTVVTIWECEWRHLKQQNQIDTTYFQECTNIITDREFLHGGRTEVFSPYANITEEDSIQYHDVCSLYPTVCALDILPIGHPDRYFGFQAQQFFDHHKVFGYIRCKIICPTNDRIGLLPNKNELTKRLTFDLLEKIGTYFANEIYFAMQYGYKVVEVYEILHFPESSRSDKYMRGYMAYFYRMKEESEGFKDKVTPDSLVEQKQQFIETIHAETPEMLPMRLPKIQKSPVFRQLAKIYLNCLWGKFGQSSEQEHKDYFYGYNEFLKYQFNVEIDKSSIRYRHVAGEGYQVIYKNTKDYYHRNSRYNAWIAAAVTSHARIRLHTQMMKIGPERILYCDTDSIFFLYPKSAPSLAARGLGKWVDEIVKDYGDEVTITKFIGLSPKNYCYLLSNGEYILKAKGVKMTLENKLKCNPEKLERMLQYKLIEHLPGYVQQEILLLDHFSIYSNSVNHEIAYGSMISLETQKQMKIVLSKRTLKHYFSEIPVHYPDNFPLTSFAKIDTFPEGYVCE